MGVLKDWCTVLVDLNFKLNGYFECDCYCKPVLLFDVVVRILNCKLSCN